MAVINVRSPRHIYVTGTNLTSADLKLYIYTGEQVTDRGISKYNLSSTAYNELITFEISEFVRDYLDVTFDGTYTSQMVWVDYQITKYISGVAQTPEAIQDLDGYDGYDFFEDVEGQSPSTGIMQSNLLQYVKSGEAYKVPIKNSNTVDVKFYDGATLVKTETIVASDDDIDQIKYFDSTTGLTPPSSIVDRIDVKQIKDLIVTSIDLVNIEECKHTPYKLTFINRFGAFQDVWFFKRTNLSLDTSKNEYKGGLFSGGSHQYKILNKQGQEKLVLNSGFIDESYNDVFRELMLSEKVWIEYDSQTLPINVSSASLPFKDSLNDKLINYTINVDFAYDKINSIR